MWTLIRFPSLLYRLGSDVMEPGWYDTEIRRFKIDKVVGWYDVWTGNLPFSQLTLKVVENADGGFCASPNIYFRSTNGIEYTCGFGDSIEKSVLDAIRAFYSEIEKYKSIETVDVDDFVWMCWTPFGPGAGNV